MIYAITIAGTVLTSSSHASWDDCWDTIYEHRIQAYAFCELIDVREDFAPKTSLRPKARTEQ